MAMTIGDIAVPLVALWLALTLLFQFRPFSRRFQTLDRLGILPRWLFFTHGVGGVVLSVEVQTRDADGRVGAWQPFDPWPPRRWWHPIFFPDHAATGILWTAVERLADRASRGDEAAVLATSQACATVRNRLRRMLPGRDFQFSVLRSDAANSSPRRLFVSGFGDT